MTSPAITKACAIVQELAISLDKDTSGEVAANLAEFPDHNAEARALIAEIDTRLAEAKKFVDAL